MSEQKTQMPHEAGDASAELLRSSGNDEAGVEPDSLGDDITYDFGDGHQLEFIIADKRWSAHFDDHFASDLHQLAIFVSALMEEKGFHACCRWTNDGEMRALNAQFRNKDKATNVLSFPDEDDGDGEGEIRLGDLAFGYETMMAEAKEMGISVGAHMRHLLIHGLLHLIGCDHENPEDAEDMEALEVAALAVIGIDNPYLGALIDDNNDDEDVS